MSTYKLTYKPFGDAAILIEWPARIDEKIINDIIDFDQRIDEDYFHLDKVTGYNSLLIKYDGEILDYEKEVSEFKRIYLTKKKTKISEEKYLWEIPVCYDRQFGLDLEEVATQNNLSVDEVIKLHTASDYLIYFLGFQPGFPYLGGLDPQIHMPRKANPRLRVAKGSVGIGGQQTGIYPQDSAGGWNLIGKSPVDFFDISQPNPCFIKAGDRMRFVSISPEEFYLLEEAICKGMYQLKKKVL